MPEAITLLVRYDRASLEATLARLRGRRFREPLRFDLSADLGTTRALAVRTLEQLLLTEAAADLRHHYPEGASRPPHAAGSRPV